MKEKKSSLLSKEVDLSYFSDNLENILVRALALIAVSFPAVELVCAMLGKHHMLMPTLLRTIGYVGFTFLLLVFLNNKTHKLVLSDLVLACMVVCTVLSIVFSFDIDSAIAGCSVNYGEDIGQVIGYFVIFFAATHIQELKNRKIILVAILVAALLHTVPAYIQHFELWPWEPENTWEFSTVSYGLTQHYNFYGALAVVFSAMTTMIFVMKNNRQYLFWYIVAILCFLAAMFSYSRLTWVGLAGYVFFIILVQTYGKIKNNESVISTKRFCAMVVSFVLITALLTAFGGEFVGQISETANEVNGNYSGSLGTGRLEIWTIGLYGVKDHLLTGLGLDNYVYAYELYHDEVLWNVAIKGHNEYIHTLVTQGLPALIVYLAMCIYVVCFSVKNYFCKENDSTKRAIIYILVVMVVGYYCQAMFNSSVTNIAPYKWLVMGLLLPRGEQKEIKCLKKRDKDEEKKT